LVTTKEELVKRLSDLRFLFSLVAVVEAVYAFTAIVTPPGQIEAVTGWVLSADGKWLVKLLGLALASQAWVAWTLRNQPHIGVAKALALYQLGSATADWVMWIVLADQNVFSTTLGQILVMISILTHYALGFLLVRAIRRASAPQPDGSRAEHLLPTVPGPHP
jgi:predicted membrane protein